MQRYGITVPFDGIPLAGQRELFAELPDLGYTDVWSSEVDGADAFTPLVLASVWAPALRLGTAIAPVVHPWAGDPGPVRGQPGRGRPGRVAIGIGASSDVIVERWNGIQFDRPLQRVRDTARFLRAALAGAKVTERYETFAVDGFRLGLVPDPPPKLLVAALRPGMLRLAGRESDGAILNWLAPGDVGTVTPYVHAAGPGREIAARIFVAPTGRPRPGPCHRPPSPDRLPERACLPGFHEWLGRGERLAPMWAAWAAGDRRAALAAIADDVVDDLLVHGPPEACRERVRQYAEAGVHTPILALLPVGGDLRETVRALGPAAD
jgi:probable F420-dependent oxidoreductase